MGSFRENYKRSLVATSTLNYFQSVIAIVTLSDAYLLTSMETILYPFSTYTWLTIIGTFLAASGITKILRRLYKKGFDRHDNHDIFEVLQLLLGLPSSLKPERDVSRILNASWMLYALVLRAVYGALLFHLIRTHVTRNVPQTVEQLVDGKYSIIINTIGITAIEDITMLQSLNIIVVNTTSETLPLEFLENLPLQQAKTAVTVAPLVVAQYYVHHYRKMSIFEVLPDNIMSFEICMYLSKHSFLIDQIHDILIWIRSFGLVEAWYRSEIDLNFLHQELITADRLFGLQQLHVLFAILCCGYIVATVVFIWELLRQKYQCCNFVRK